MSDGKKMLLVQVAALGWDFVHKYPPPPDLPTFNKLAPEFPALTCTAQASFRTASALGRHGMIGNGLFFRDLRRASLWEQSASLVEGPRFWRDWRAAGKKVGMLFWQQSLGEEADLIVSPRPIHKHHGGMIQDCYSRPEPLYARLCEEIGGFNLMHYWGPLASHKSTQWIVTATRFVMRDPSLAPDLLLTYLPHLDYDLQRHGPDSTAARRAAARIYEDLRALIHAAGEAGYEAVVFGDYAIEPVVGGPVYLNRVLRDAGFLAVRHVRGMAYPDFFTSRAFALADHQVSNVFIADPADVPRVSGMLRALPGVSQVMDRDAQQATRLHHTRSGELLVSAQAGYWFAYPWWTERREAPDYASHVDIHNKPGYDPCELYFGWPPGSISRDPARIRGTHGRAGPGCEMAWSTTGARENQPTTLIDLARGIKENLILR